jgi:hypothetical protein
MVKKYTKAIEGYNVSISCDETAENQAQALFRILEQQNKLTPLFKETCTIRVGWCYYYIEKPESGKEYTVMCPDFSKDPLKDRTENLTAAIVTQDMMIDALGRSKVKKPNDIFFGDTVTVSQAVMPGLDLSLQRMETKKQGDSGWTIVLENPTEEDKKKPMVNVLVCHIMKLNPALLGLLALPAGTKITTSDGQKKFHVSMKDVEK